MSANNQLRFDGRVAVVTGAGAGLGREYALLFAERGAKVVVNDLGGSPSGEGQSSRAADVVVEEIRSKGGVACANYDSVTEGEKIIQTAVDNFGRVDILVNNAGILRDRSFAKISDQDMRLILDVHLWGSFKTTQAAWPIFKKQNYGRIIMTTSNSGIYGNFGQSNYSAAKLALIGLMNSLAIEGERNNIFCNCITPTAASRLTKDILPEALYNELKPKLIAPVVAYLCHESSEDNGSVIESAAGWATKIHNVRGKGAVLRSSISEEVTPEKVRDAWSKVTDMSEAEHLGSITEATGSLVQILDGLMNPVDATATNVSSNAEPAEDTFNFSNKDLIIYALGVGATVKDNVDLKFLYENHAEFSPLPTYFILPGLMLLFSTNLVTKALTHTEFNLSQLLHGEQYLEAFDDLPTEGSLRTVGKVVDVCDKKSGAVIHTQCDTFDESGKLLFRNQSACFIVGAGNFGGKSQAGDHVIPAVPTPDRAPDAVVKLPTSIDQAALYRMSGDLNPLHIDPDFAKMGGQSVPILHGLCSLGFSVRAVIQAFASNDAFAFKAVKGRFTKPVIPGQTLKVEMWQNNLRIHFKTSVLETGVEVITGAYVDLKKVTKASSTGAALKTDEVFNLISERVKANPNLAKQVNAVLLFNITVDGKVVKNWTLDFKSMKMYADQPQGVKADTTLTISDGDFFDIASKRLNPQVAFMKGLLKIVGNPLIVQKLAKILKAESKL